MYTDTKPRSIPELAKIAYEIQDACNLSGVLWTFAQVLGELKQQPEYRGSDWVHNHPITRAFADKIASLTGTQGRAGSDRAFDAIGECHKLAHVADVITSHAEVA